MTPARAIAMLDSQIRRHGEDIIVRRYTAPTGSPRPKIDVAARAFVRAVKADALVGDIKQTHSDVTVSPTGIAALLPLRTGDKLVIQGKERDVTSAKPVLVAGVLARIDLLVAG